MYLEKLRDFQARLYDKCLQKSKYNANTVPFSLSLHQRCIWSCLTQDCLFTLSMVLCVCVEGGGSYFVRCSSVRLYVYSGLLKFQADNLIFMYYHLCVYVCLFVCVCMFESVVYMMFDMHGGCTPVCNFEALRKMSCCWDHLESWSPAALPC